MFFIMLSCFSVLSCWLAVFLCSFNLIKKLSYAFLQINSSYNVNEIKDHLSDLKRDILTHLRTLLKCNNVKLKFDFKVHFKSCYML